MGGHLGEKGEAGLKGFPGFPGAKGFNGDQGPVGSRGANGVFGKKGKHDGSELFKSLMVTFYIYCGTTREMFAVQKLRLVTLRNQYEQTRIISTITRKVL